VVPCIRERALGRDANRKSHVIRTCRAVLCILAFVLIAQQSVVRAETVAPASETPPHVEEFLKLLADPAVQKWLAGQQAEVSKAAAVQPPLTHPADVAAERLAAVRGHLMALAAALPRLPAELAKGWRTLRDESSRRGLLEFLGVCVLFVGLGLGLQGLYGLAIRGKRDRLFESNPATERDRVLVLARRLIYGLGGVAAFALGSIGPFLFFEWPPLLKTTMLALILAVLLYLIVRVILCACLAPAEADPGHEPFRVIPLESGAARYWTRRLTQTAAVFAFGWALAKILHTLGLSREVVQLIAYAIGLGLLALGLDMVWRHGRAFASGFHEASPARWRIDSRAMAWLLTAYFLLIWVTWVAGTMNLFWLLSVSGLLIATVRFAQRAVNHLFPTEITETGAEMRTMTAAVVERTIRVLLIAAALLLLAWGWDIEFEQMAERDTLTMRLLRGAFSAAIILLVADFAWQVLRALIDNRIARAHIEGVTEQSEVERRMRLRTLLPIVRNVVFVTLAVVAVLMALSALGVEIGPLIAGAGIVGVAVGFGAQTLVKDVISGMFYLLDDAFRVGEYIESGNFKGTVESFSLRSVKLRHHRGPIFTVPFGELGAIQNMSRDWVIDKMLIGITYDSDIEKARKIIKKIGLELAEDPEFKNDVIEPLKMQGVENFSDFAVQLRLKMKTKPGAQFPMRRRAFALIKQAFDANGIKFAFPTVTVAGKAGEGEIAAAQEMLSLQSAAPRAATA
jgi:small-conductance mechanosensitive channel